jgi:diacylglycerol O-acyltransferase / wax synthase
MRGLKESGQAVGAEVITSLADFAPPTILAQAARLQSVQRLFNLTVTNVPGPQFPLYLLGRPLARVYPQVPLAESCALGIAIMSYNGHIDFGLLADYDAVPDLDEVAAGLEASIAELAGVAGIEPPPAAEPAVQHA